MNFNEEYEKRLTEIESILTRYLPEKEGYQKIIMEAMEYSLMAGGKRLRPMLMLESSTLIRWSMTTCRRWTMMITAGGGRPPMWYTAKTWGSLQGMPC